MKHMARDCPACYGHGWLTVTDRQSLRGVSDCPHPRHLSKPDYRGKHRKSEEDATQ